MLASLVASALIVAALVGLVLRKALAALGEVALEEEFLENMVNKYLEVVGIYL